MFESSNQPLFNATDSYDSNEPINVDFNIRPQSMMNFRSNRPAMLSSKRNDDIEVISREYHIG